MNVHWIGNRATITFTHPRARSESLFEGKQAPMDLVVRARVATTIENVVALRDLLIHLFPSIDPPPKSRPAVVLPESCIKGPGYSLSKALKDIRSRRKTK